MAAPPPSRTLLVTGVVAGLCGASDADAGLVWESLCQEVLVQPGRAVSGAAASAPRSQASPRGAAGTWAGPVP